MNIETVLLIVIVTFACGFVLDRWNMRLSRSRRRQAVRSSRASQRPRAVLHLPGLRPALGNGLDHRLDVKPQAEMSSTVSCT
jgi:hypothetical protein